MKGLLERLMNEGLWVEAFLDADDPIGFQVCRIESVGSEWFSAITIAKDGEYDGRILAQIEHIYRIVTDSVYLNRISKGIEIALDLSAYSRSDTLKPDITQALEQLIEKKELIQIDDVGDLDYESLPISIKNEVLEHKVLDPNLAEWAHSYIRIEHITMIEVDNQRIRMINRSN